MLSFELGMLSGGLTGGVLLSVAVLSYLTFLVRQIYWHHLSKLVFLFPRLMHSR
jgi:hypothetical protein